MRGRAGSVGPTGDQPAPVGRQVPEAIGTKVGDRPGPWLGGTRASTRGVFRRQHQHTVAQGESRLSKGMSGNSTPTTATRQRQGRAPAVGFGHLVMTTTPRGVVPQHRQNGAVDRADWRLIRRTPGASRGGSESRLRTVQRQGRRGRTPPTRHGRRGCSGSEGSAYLITGSSSKGWSSSPPAGVAVSLGCRERRTRLAGWHSTGSRPGRVT